MRKMTSRLLLVSALVLASCGSENNERATIDAQVTETRMDDIDKIEGTINDDMINIDESNSQPPLAKNDVGGAPSSEEDAGDSDNEDTSE